MVDKDAMFDELSKKFPPGNYSNFCNKMGVDYNQAKQMLTRCKENYTEAIRDLIAQWDQRKGGVSREELEKALTDADIGGLCSISRKHYEKAAAIPSGNGDGAVPGNRNQHIHNNQSDVTDSGHVKQIGSSNTTAAPVEVNEDVVHGGGDTVMKPSRQAATVRDIGATAPMEDDDGDDVYDRRGPTKSQAQSQLVAAAKSIDESHGRPDNPAQRQSGLVKSHTAVEDTTGRARGGDSTANIKLERITENKGGDKSITTFIMTGATKEHITFLGIGILCVAVGLFIYHRQKN